MSIQFIVRKKNLEKKKFGRTALFCIFIGIDYRFIIGKIIIRVGSKYEDYDQNVRWIEFIYRNMYIYVEQSNILLSHVIPVIS